MSALGRRVAAAASWRARAISNDLVFFRVRFAAWLAYWRHRADYQLLDEAGLRRTRRSDTVFIIGSGYSLNRMTAAEWAAIGAHNTIGFNWSVHERFVRCDYHLLREVCADDLDRAVWEPATREYFRLVADNPCYARTIFLVQSGFRAISANRAIGMRLVPRERPIFLWRSRANQSMPSHSLREGLTHMQGTLSECVNFAALLGWTSIVLAGIDLYDRRYFWLPENEPRVGDTTVDLLHSTASNGIVDGMRRWHEYFADRRIRLFVYNPDSLLARVLPVWSWT